MAPSTWGPHRITDDDHGPWVTIMAILLMVYMILCYLARLVMRFTINGPFGIDDWVITAGSAVAVVHSSFKLLETREGLGKRGVDVEGSNISNIEKVRALNPGKWVGKQENPQLTNTGRICCLSAMSPMQSFSSLEPSESEMSADISPLANHRNFGDCSGNLADLAPHVHSLGFASESRIQIGGAIGIFISTSGLTQNSVFAVAIIRIFYLRKQNRLDDPIFYGADSSTCMEAEVHYSLIAASIPCLKPFVKAFNTGYLGQQGLHPGTKHAKHAHAGGYQLAAMSGAKDKPVGPDNVMFPAETASGALPVVEQILDTQQQGSDVPSFGASDRISIRRTTICARRPRVANPCPGLSRTYHSSFHPAPEPPADTYTPEQSAILSGALQYVPEHGFSIQSLTLGARDAGYLDVSLQLFPKGGEIELITYWLASRRGLLRRKVENGEVFGESGVTGGRELSVDEKVKILILERLKMNEGIIQHWQDALATMSLPFNITPSLAELYALSSDILHLANDRSVNTSWYTKRLSVATVYASADVVMTEDKSVDFTATREFVERRIGDCQSVTDSVGDAKQFLGFVAGSMVGVGRSWGMKI
ncbi:Ubiquinone biosynthesis protein coq9, mitochondrial [Emmonsiellopsis sp. PD_33]|nr:Ubiquinone biosynthesis protein coq9, mitochondrial [Emmonsiellopsis sp. PD_33]